MLGQACGVMATHSNLDLLARMCDCVLVSEMSLCVPVSVAIGLITASLRVNVLCSVITFL